MDPAVLQQLREALPSVRVPQHHDKVYKDECAFSFHSPESEGGLFVNLSTFQSYSAKFVGLDHERTGNRVYFHQQWRKVPKKPAEDDAPAAAPTKLAIGVVGGFPTAEQQFDYEKAHHIVLLPEQARVPFPNPELPELISQCAEAVLAHDDGTRQAEAATWEEEYKESKFASGLEQLPANRRISPDPADWKCDLCDLRNNLWLNLSTGQIGCGRRHWDGSGGNGHALQHFEETGSRYPLCVKLGTITPSGADVYSYSPEENDMVLDPKLEQHLRHWGINMMSMSKTEKTLVEMQIDLNRNFEYNRISEDGEKLVHKAGPGFVGLRNLGNSCYVNSLLQVLFALPELAARFFDPSDHIFRSAPAVPMEDLHTQLAKLAVALLTNEYVPAEGEGEGVEPEAAHVAPLALKTLVGRGHPDFSTGQQQDTLEFYQHFLSFLHRAHHAAGGGAPGAEAGDASALFDFTVQDRLLCEQSGKVRYATHKDNVLSLSIPLAAATNQEEVAAYERRRALREQQQQQQAAAAAAASAGQETVTQSVEGPEAKRARVEIAESAGIGATGGSGKAGEAEEEPVRPHVPFDACVQDWLADKSIADFLSPATGARGTAVQTARLASFPRYLTVHLRRYILGADWTPKKLDAFVAVPEVLDLRAARGRGRQAGEEELPEGGGGGGGAAAAAVQPDEELVVQLCSMGFPESRCRRAAVAVSNSGAEAAMNWLLAHMDDDEEEEAPAAPAGGAGGGGGADPESVAMVVAMGFTERQAQYALSQTGGSVERAVDWLFSHDGQIPAEGAAAPAGGGGGAGGAAEAAVEDGEGVYELVGIVSHIGKNTGSGHYVCHVKKGGRWYIFNDRLVAVSRRPPFDLGYMYFFRRRDARAVPTASPAPTCVSERA